VLHGDLVLQGEGDPDLDLPALRGLLQRARQRGMVGWRGRLVLDRSAFEPARPDLHLPPFDDAPEFEYNTVPDALMVDGNLLRIDLRVGEQGLQLWPATPIEGLHLSHAMTLVEGGCERWEALWKPPLYTPASWGRDAELRLQGAWPAGCERRVSLNVLPRNQHIERVVRTLWRELGGHWQGAAVDGRAPPDAHVLAEHASRPLGELVRAINKPSDNALTRLVALALGARSPGAAGDPTLTRAGQAIRRWMHSRGIDERGFVFDNGSGLSRSERLTPAQLEAVVRAGLASPWAPEFLASLPLVGLDGTMRRRLQDGPAAGRARLKTGTLRNVVALAGTLPDAAGRPLVLAAILNHELVRPATARPVMGRHRRLGVAAGPGHHRRGGGYSTRRQRALIASRSPTSKCHHSVLMPRQPPAAMASRNRRRCATAGSSSTPRSSCSRSSAGCERSLVSSKGVPRSSSCPCASASVTSTAMPKEWMEPTCGAAK
jgi:D-alanyl-D-alanine carboxypeptidase/D-alanyl-D-alanine-endopeptidase (penicillin-binding protein 4)